MAGKTDGVSLRLADQPVQPNWHAPISVRSCVSKNKANNSWKMAPQVDFWHSYMHIHTCSCSEEGTWTPTATWWTPRVLNFSSFLPIETLYNPFWAFLRKGIRLLLQNLNIKIIGSFLYLPGIVLNYYIHYGIQFSKQVKQWDSFYLVLERQKWRHQTLSKKCKS